MKLKNKLSMLLMLSPALISPFFLAASCKEKTKYKEKLQKLQKDYDAFIKYVEKSSATKAKEIINDNKTKELKKKIDEKLNNPSKINSSSLNEIEETKKAIIKKFKDSLLNDLFNLNREFNNPVLWSEMKSNDGNKISSDNDKKIELLYSTIKKLNYSELSQIKFDNSKEDNEKLQNIEKKLVTWKELKTFVTKIINDIRTKSWDELFKKEVWNQLSNTNDKMLKEFSNEFNRIKEVVSSIKNSNNLVAKYTLSKITERRLGDLEEILNTDIHGLDETIKLRFQALKTWIEARIENYDPETKNMFTELIKKYEPKINNVYIDDLNDFLAEYLKLFNKVSYKYALNFFDDVFDKKTESGKIFEKAKENINKSNNQFLKKYFDNLINNVKSLQRNPDNLDWIKCMETNAELTSLIETFEFNRLKKELAEKLEIFEKHKIYEFEKDEEIKKLNLRIKQRYESAKTAYESMYSATENVENANNNLKEILENPRIKEKLK